MVLFLHMSHRLEFYADQLFHGGVLLSELAVIDASPYEGATIVHDLNTPVDTSLHERFDVVIDGGDLEHVFNIPVALANLMSMLTVGGTMLLVESGKRSLRAWLLPVPCGIGLPGIPSRARVSCRTSRALVESRFPHVLIDQRMFTVRRQRIRKSFGGA